MGTAAEVDVAWLNEEADDSRKKPTYNNRRRTRRRRQNGDDMLEDDDWTREYDVDREIEDHERWWDTRLGQIDRICRGMDAAIMLGLWGCAIYFYWVWFYRIRHHSAAAADSSTTPMADNTRTTLHVAVVISAVLLGVLYGVRAVGVVFGLRIITGSLLTVQIGLFTVLMIERSWYAHHHHDHRHGTTIAYHLLCTISGTAMGSELVRLVFIVWLQRRRRWRRMGMDGTSEQHEPLLDGVEWQMRQQEWASRTEDDPLWWSREEEYEEDGENDDDEQTFYSCSTRHGRFSTATTMVDVSAGREPFS